MASEATETTFQETVLDSDGKVIVDFWAEWCGPCHAVAPVLDRIADEHGFSEVSHTVEIFGTCADCTATRAGRSAP